MGGIPIRNLYLLLCYALDQPPAAQEAWKDGEEGGGCLGLLARLLLVTTRQVLHRGLDRWHLPQRELLGTVRGRIDLGSTLGSLQHRQARLWCEFEEYLPDVLHNQILKTTLARLARHDRLPADVRRSIPALLRRFSAVAQIDLRAGLFRHLYLGRQNAQYRLPMGLCELIFLSQLAGDWEGYTRFLDFLRDQFTMAKVFEDFIRNFLRFHGAEVGLKVIERRQIPWSFDADPDWGNFRREAFIPSMEADVLVQSERCLTVLDAKFYEKTVKAKFGGSPKLYAANLYQIQAYVEALAQHAASSDDQNLEGMLIYPATDGTPPVTYKLRGHRYHVRTLDLNRKWDQVHTDLLTTISRP